MTQLLPYRLWRIKHQTIMVTEHEGKALGKKGKVVPVLT